MRWAAALAALLLMLPMVGPLVDHHFAERLPYHDHLFLGEGANHSHTHLVGRPHTHRPAGISQFGPPNPFDPFGDFDIPAAPGEAGDTLFFASNTGWTPPATCASVLSLLTSLAILLGLMASTWRLYVHPIFAYRVDLPPPKDPPRRSLLSTVIVM
jgi:hypothetical protein